MGGLQGTKKKAEKCSKQLFSQREGWRCCTGHHTPFSKTVWAQTKQTICKVDYFVLITTSKLFLFSMSKQQAFSALFSHLCIITMQCKHWSHHFCCSFFSHVGSRSEVPPSVSHRQNRPLVTERSLLIVHRIAPRHSIRTCLRSGFHILQRNCIITSHPHPGHWEPSVLLSPHTQWLEHTLNILYL